MPKITKIAKQQRRDDWCSIFIDGKFVFSLPISAVADEKLVIDKELSAAELDKLKRKSSYSKLYDGALMKIARRQHSEREIRDYLYKKQAADEDIESIVERLYSYKYLDDQSFAEKWVSERRKTKLRSSRQLRAELYKKGISSEIIDPLLEDSQEDQQDALKELIAKKQHLSRYQDQKKFMAYLTRQGFSYHEVKQALTELED